MKRWNHEQGSCSADQLPPSYEEIAVSSQNVEQASFGGKSFLPEYPPSYSGPEQQHVRVVYLPAPDFGPNSVKIVCSSCQATVTTTTSSRPSMMAWAVSCVLCFTMLWPCFCVPFCVDSLKNVKHTCPNCKSTLGRYKGGL